MTNKVEELILEVAITSSGWSSKAVITTGANKEMDGKNGMKLIDNQFVEYTDENNHKTITPLLIGMKDFIKRLFYNI